jgi:cytochrome c oxidase assembly protein subunit 15
MRLMSALAGVGVVLTLVVTTSSAYIRLQQIETACAHTRACAGARPEPPSPAEVSGARAVHRVAASSIGLIVLAIAVLAWRGRGSASLRASATLALLITLFLAAIGRQASTMDAAIVAGNVCGGMALASVLAWLAVRARATDARTRMHRWMALTATLVGSTIALGAVPGAYTLHGLAGIATAIVLVAQAVHGPLRYRTLAIALAGLGVLQLGLGPAAAAVRFPVALGVAHNVVAAVLAVGLAGLFAQGGVE